MNVDELPPPYEDHVPPLFLRVNEWQREALAPIETQPSAPAWGIIHNVHNSVAPDPASSTTEIQRAPEKNAKCVCACFCASCKWKPCKCDGELQCFNCLVFLGYSLLCLPVVNCYKWPHCCGYCCWLCLCCGCFSKYEFDMDADACYSEKCVDRCGLAHCWPRMGFSLKCKSVENVLLNCTENPEEGSDDHCNENCSCFYGEDESEDQLDP